MDAASLIKNLCIQLIESTLTAAMEILVSHPDEFEEQDLQLVKLLEISPEFERLIKTARKRCGITEALTSYETPDVYEAVQNEAKEIVVFFNLPDSWLYPMEELIAFERLPAPWNIIASSDDEYSLDWREEFTRVSPLTISVYQKTSWEKFHQWVLSNKQTVRKHLVQLPRKRSIIKKNLVLQLEVLELGSMGKGKKPREILRILDKKYTHDEDMQEQLSEITGPQISRWLHNYKRRLRGLPLR